MTMPPDPPPSAANGGGFQFTGKTGEFFGIWLANVLLTTLTLGVFSAWAKVRTKRYFYANTRLHGANFEYHAKPLSILLARAILVLLVVGGVVWADKDLAKNAVYSTVLLFFLPWAIVRGLSFNARNSSHRGLRLSFRRRYKTAYWLSLPLIVAALAPTYYFYFRGSPAPGSPTLFFAAAAAPWLAVLFLSPLLMRGFHQFKAENHYWGASPFSFSAPAAGKYIAAILGTMVFQVAAYAAVAFALSKTAPAIFGDDNFEMFVFIWLVVSYFLLALFFFVIKAKLLKLFWNNIVFDGGAIRCDLSPMKFALHILTVNFLATIVSLGLLHPWAQIRRARFLARHIFVVADAETIDAVAAGRREREGALGEELDASQGFDFDIALV